MNKVNIWVVTAHRTTLSEHSYVVGLYENFEDAKKAANIEQYNRGGKYNMDINGYILNKLPEEIINNEI
jgi:hypothetical protein